MIRTSLEATHYTKGEQNVGRVCNRGKINKLLNSNVKWTEIGVQLLLATKNDIEDLIICNSIKLPRLQMKFYSI